MALLPQEYRYQRLLVDSAWAWLQEERLYMSGQFLTSLPPELNPAKLDHLIQVGRT